MPRLAVLRSLVVVVLVSLLTLNHLAVAAQQQDADNPGGTPGPTEGELPGVAFTPLAQVLVDEMPPAPADLFFARFTFDPGAGFPLDPADPALALVLVESGTLTIRTVTDVQVTRVAVAGTPVAGQVAVGGVETQLEVGDSALFPPFIAGEIRNAGTEPVVLLAAIIEPVGAPADATPMAATPGAEGTPLAEDEGAPAGLSFQALAFGQVEQLPTGPAAIAIGRLMLAPGATIPAHPHPGPEFGVVEEGTVAFTVSEGQVEIIRGVTTATPGPEAPETEMVTAGQETTLQAGDGVFYHPGAVADLRNEGDTPVVLLGGGIEPLTGEMATPMAATPAT